MSKVSGLARHAREMLIAITIIASFVLIGGCGGGSSSASVPPPGGGSPQTPTTPTTVEGVATPTSVAVVTATNAQ